MLYERESVRGETTREGRTIREEYLSHCMDEGDDLFWNPRSAWMYPASGRVRLGR
jgi:hypothetical protein